MDNYYLQMIYQLVKHSELYSDLSYNLIYSSFIIIMNNIDKKFQLIEFLLTIVYFDSSIIPIFRKYISIRIVYNKIDL